MISKLEILQSTLKAVFGDNLLTISEAFGELTVVVQANDYLEVVRRLHDELTLDFAQLIDLCGVDYAGYGDTSAEVGGLRFAVVLHLLSLTHNWRLRVKVFAPDSALPIVPSVVEVWNSANWYEREAFDLFGIVFDGHPDLRRILTDYGFIGHPFRKDFPTSGYVEMRYDETEKRVIYQPVTIEPRELTPRVIREGRYGEN